MSQFDSDLLVRIHTNQDMNQTFWDVVVVQQGSDFMSWDRVISFLYIYKSYYLFDIMFNESFYNCGEIKNLLYA